MTHLNITASDLIYLLLRRCKREEEEEKSHTYTERTDGLSISYIFLKEYMCTIKLWLWLGEIMIFFILRTSKVSKLHLSTYLMMYIASIKLWINRLLPEINKDKCKESRINEKHLTQKFSYFLMFSDTIKHKWKSTVKDHLII